MTLIHTISEALRTRFQRGAEVDPSDPVDVRLRLDGMTAVRAAVEAEVARGWVLAESLASEGRAAVALGSVATARVALDRRRIVLERLYGLGAAYQLLADAEVGLVQLDMRLRTGPSGGRIRVT